MKILVINAGSSSIKYQLFRMPSEEVLAKGVVERIGEPQASLTQTVNGAKHVIEQPIGDHEQAMELILSTLTSPETRVLEDISEIQAVGHRVVHGGEEFTGSVAITPEVIESLERYADLAPLHNPPNLVGIRAAQAKLPNVVHVGCFDTAFHTSIPKVAYLYGLPYEMYEKYRIRKYGFHGTSHRYVAQRASEMLGHPFEQVNLITCHLGNGCSITAVRDGKSVDTSMGLTPLEGVMMGTRSGDLDPAIIFYLCDKGYSVDEINTMCNKKGGLLGISGKSNDMRTLTELAGQGDERSQLALAMFNYRIRKYVGMYLAVLGRVDAIVFTGGIGENNPHTRAAVCEGLEPLGIALDPAKNEAKFPKAGSIHTDESKVSLFVIPTNEEAAIAADTYELAR